MHPWKPRRAHHARDRRGSSQFKARGIAQIAFGDLFLLYPIWMRDTDDHQLRDSVLREARFNYCDIVAA
jgi:hypothetical protein